MTCDEWKAFLQDYVSGVLSEPARASIERHLSDCAACFSEARAHKMVENHLRAQPALVVPEGLVDRIVECAMPRREFRFRRELLRIAAVFVTVIGLGAAAAAAGLEDRLPTARVESARRAIESSFRGALSVPDLFKR